MVTQTLLWGDKVIHDQKGEGVVIKDDYVSVIKVLFKKNDEVCIFRENDSALRKCGGEW